MDTSLWWGTVILVFAGNTTSQTTDLPDGEAALGATQVVGVAGQPVSLPCDVSSAGNDAVALVLWYKDEGTTPIYSLDARQGGLTQARHAARDARARLDVRRSPAVLTVDPAMERDAGLYRCRADYRKARTRYSAVQLQIVVSPEPPIILDTEGDRLQSLIGPYNEGDPLQLTCQTRGGKPQPRVTWWRESVLLDDSYDAEPGGVTVNVLEIPALQRHDLMAVLSCQASNTNLTVPPASASVTVDMNFRPLDVQIDGTGPVSAGKTVELACRATGSRPPATVTWWLASTRLSAARHNVSVDGNVTASVLRLVADSADHGKHLSCRAENPLIPGSAIEHGWRLDVHYAPQLTLRLGNKLRHSHIQEGNDVYLECSVRANPHAPEVGWRFEARELHTNTSAGVIVSNQSLVLQRVHRLSRGRYTCTAANGEGRGESNAVQLRVQYAPVCQGGLKSVYGAAQGEVLRVVCEVESDPRPTEYVWEYNGTETPAPSVSYINEGQRSIATVVPRGEHGLLLCWARNSVGLQVEPCVFTLAPAGPPDPARNCRLLNVSGRGLDLHCVAGHDGGSPQKVVLEIHDVALHSLVRNLTELPASSGGLDEENNGNLLVTFRPRDLVPGRDYLLVVYCHNSKGRSEPLVLRTRMPVSPESHPRTVRKEEDIWQVAPSPTFVILIAATAGLVLVACLVVMGMKLRHRHVRARNSNSSKDDKSQTPLRKDTDDDWKSCSCVGDEKCPDIIPAKLKENVSEEMTSDPFWKIPLSESETSGKPPLSEASSPALLHDFSPTRPDQELQTISRQTKV